MAKMEKAQVPPEIAAVNLMAHPVAGFAAAGALGLGMASHAVGLWMGAIAGMAEASRKLVADTVEVPPTPSKTPAGLKLVSSTPAPVAAAAVARTIAADAEIAARNTDEARVEGVMVPVQLGRPAKARAVDDLKAIAGIGPKLEKVLNGLGIFTYEQVAKLTTAEIAKLDEELGFAGRIERDDWLGQAAKLAGK